MNICLSRRNELSCCVFLNCSMLKHGIWFVHSSNFSARACVMIGVRLYILFYFYLFCFYFLYDFVMMIITLSDGSHCC